MSHSLAQQAGSALLWKAAQLAGVKGIYLLRLVILARLLSPEDFGLVAVALLAVDLLLRLSDFGMVPALVQGSQVDDRHYHTAWTVGVARSLGVAAVVFVAAPFIATVLGEPLAADIMRALALRPVLSAAASIKIAELTRNLSFRSLAFINLPEALVNTLVSIALAGALGVWALVAGALAGATTLVVMSYLIAPHRPRLSLDGAATRSLASFGRWIFVTGLITIAGSAALQLVIFRQLGAAELGLYVLAARLAYLPYEVASEVVGSVAFPLYARLQSDVRQVARVFQTIFLGTAALLVPIYALIIVLAPSLVEEVLGPRWEGTAPAIQILALVGVVGMFGDASVPLLKGLGHPHKVTVLEGIHSLLIILLAWGLAGSYGLTGAVLAQLLATSASQFFSGVFVYRMLGWSPSRLKGPLMAIAVVSVGGAAIGLGIDSVAGGIAGLIAGACVATLFVGLLLWLLDRLLNLGLVDAVPRAFPQLGTLLRPTPTDG